MTKTIPFFLLFLFTFAGWPAAATTWDEPWAEDVIRKASTFVLARVTSSDEEQGIHIRVIKTLGGQPVPDSLLISGWYLLNICSRSGHGPEFRLAPMDSCYFFLSRDTAGRYCMATPTTGFSPVDAGLVKATYRHSYHQASVPVTLFERTMTGIFRHYHGLSYDRPFFESLIQEQLTKQPGDFSDASINTFFIQHVALESIYHLGLPVAADLLLPFLNDRANVHNQLSSARAMRSVRPEDARELLMAVIADSNRDNMVRVLCIRSLAAAHPEPLKPRLQALEKTASTEDAGFGGNIMDPRICTHMPTVREALKELIRKL